MGDADPISVEQKRFSPTEPEFWSVRISDDEDEYDPRITNWKIFGNFRKLPSNSPKSEDVRSRSAAIERLNVEGDLKLKSLGFSSFLRLHFPDLRGETDVLVAGANFMQRYRGKDLLILYDLAVNLFRFMVSKSDIKSCPAGSTAANSGNRTQNEGNGGTSMSNTAAEVSTENTNSTFSRVRPTSQGGNDGDDPNDNNFHLYRGPSFMTSWRGWFQLFLVILTVVVELLSLFASLLSTGSNSVMSLLTAQNAAGILLVGLITSIIMLAIYVFTYLIYGPVTRRNSQNDQP